MRRFHCGRFVLLSSLLWLGWPSWPPAAGGNLVANGSFETSFDAAGHTRDNRGWVRKEIYFTAHGEKTTLSFSNASPVPTASGVALDNVAVAEGNPGRFTVRPSGDGMILVDAVTGAAWKLTPFQGKTAWLPVENSEPIARLQQSGAKLSMKDGALRSVDLTDSAITDADMTTIGSLTSLEHLTLNGCRLLTDAGLAHVKRLSKLKGLGLERTRITDVGLSHLSGLTGLEYLSLNGTHVGDAGLKHLVGLNRLAVLYLCGTGTTDAGLRAVKNTPALQWLDLRGTRVTDSGLAHLGGLGRLRLLSLHGTSATDAGMALLTELPSLEVLTLSRTSLTDAGLLALKKSPKLIDLDVTGTRVTQAGVNDLKGALPNCQVRFGGEPAAIGPWEEQEPPSRRNHPNEP